MRELFVLLALVGPLMLGACSDDDNGNPADTTNPEVTILQPQNGANVPAADVLIRAQATDNQGVAKAEFYVDGTMIGEDLAGPADVYEFTWGASGLSPGSSHVIRVRALDTSNNANEASIAVTINPQVGTIHSDEIIADETWAPSGNPHIVTGAIGVAGAATLTILPGCIVQFEPNVDAGIGVGWQPTTGALIAVGTPTSPILFTSLADVPQRGDWRGLSFFGGILGTTRLSYCTIEYTGYDGGAAVYVAWGASLPMDHCWIRHAGGRGVGYEHAGHVDQFHHNTITTCADYPLETEPEFVRYLGDANSFTGNDPGKDKILLYSGVVVTSATWHNQGVPYELAPLNDGDGILITPTEGTPAILTIEAGTTIRFSEGAQLMVGFGGSTGGLIAVGTAQSPITFTSAAGSPQPGDWHQLNFADGTVDTQTRLEHCIIEYGGRGGYGNVLIADAVPAIANCTLRHGASYGFFLTGLEHPDPGQLEGDNAFQDNAGANVFVER